jgi:hypothetical protein
VLFILNGMREEGLIPAETIFKFSVFGGYCSGAGAKVIESMGANSMNPISDVSLPILGSIRQAADLPLDVYVIIVDSFGGMFRAYEAPEIARVASPCYFKFEPGTSEGDIYKPWITEAWHANLIREKVKIASIVMEIMQKHAPELKTSPKGPGGPGPAGGGVIAVKRSFLQLPLKKRKHCMTTTNYLSDRTHAVEWSASASCLPWPPRSPMSSTWASASPISTPPIYP